MRFTKDMSINAILDRPGMKDYIHVFFPKKLLDCVPEKQRRESIAQMENNVKMPWGGPFISEDFLQAAEKATECLENKSYKFIPLWVSDNEYKPKGNNNKESVFLMTPTKKFLGKRPAVIICPGGGYELLSFDTEGIELAEKMEKAGYSPFILSYRVNPNCFPEPQIDLALAIRYLKVNAVQYGIESEKIMLMGSSAGGHLCGSFIENQEEIDEALNNELDRNENKQLSQYKDISVKPAMLCMNYSVISFGENGHEESFQALTGGNEMYRDKLSLEKHVGVDFPKTFLWACEDDELVPVSNTVKMGEALKQNNIPYCMKIFPQGGHGCGIGLNTSAEKWMEIMLKYMD